MLLTVVLTVADLASGAAGAAGTLVEVVGDLEAWVVDWAVAGLVEGLVVLEEDWVVVD